MRIGNSPWTGQFPAVTFEKKNLRPPVRMQGGRRQMPMKLTTFSWRACAMTAASACSCFMTSAGSDMPTAPESCMASAEEKGCNL